MAQSSTMTVRLNPAVKKQLERLARTTGRTKSYLAAEAIKAYLENEAWQIAAIEEGIKSADAGQFVEHAKVKAWLESWGSEHEREPPACK